MRNNRIDYINDYPASSSAYQYEREAACFGDIGVFHKMVQEGKDIKFESGIALPLAAQNGHLDLVKFLVEHGLKPNECNNTISVNHAEVLQYLLDNGSDPGRDHASIIWASAAAKKNLKIMDTISKYCDKKQYKIPDRAKELALEWIGYEMSELKKFQDIVRYGDASPEVCVFLDDVTPESIVQAFDEQLSKRTKGLVSIGIADPSRIHAKIRTSPVFSSWFDPESMKSKLEQGIIGYMFNVPVHLGGALHENSIVFVYDSTNTNVDKA